MQHVDHFTSQPKQSHTRMRRQPVEIRKNLNPRRRLRKLKSVFHRRHVHRVDQDGRDVTRRVRRRFVPVRKVAWRKRVRRRLRGAPSKRKNSTARGWPFSVTTMSSFVRSTIGFPWPSRATIVNSMSVVPARNVGVGGSWARRGGINTSAPSRRTKTMRFMGAD